MNGINLFVPHTHLLMIIHNLYLITLRFFNFNSEIDNLQ